MRKIQKVAAPLLAGVLCLTAAACAAGAGPSGAGEASEAQEVPAVEPVPAAGQDPAPEPVLEEAADYALAISDQPIPTVEGCLVSDRLPVRFINNTGEDGYVLDIPHLERKNEAGEWEPVPWREDASELLRIYQGAKWTDVTADCLNDYRLVIAGETVYFHSDCGTFNDNKNNRSFTVPEEDRTAILAMLRAE